MSVVLPVVDEARTIHATLAALAAQTYPSERLEILVVDGGSRDGTRDIVSDVGQGDPRVRLVDNPARITPAGLNAGVRAALGDVIVRMDGHAEAAADYIERGVRLLSDSGAWAVGGRMDKVGTTSAQQANAIAASSPVGVGDAAHNFAKDARWVETVFLGIWPRWVFDRVGLFDEELVRNQDDEHAFRIRAAGGRIRYDPSLVVRYHPRPGLLALFEQYRQYGYWKVRVFQKHPRAARWRHLVPAVFVAALVVGTVMAPWSRPGAAVLVGTLASYAAVVGGATLRMDTPGTTRPRVFAAIAALHLGYGFGFWQGLARFGTAWRRAPGAPS